MNLQRNLLKLLRMYSTKPRRKANPLTQLLMVYRNAPLNGTLQSPMQILQGRQACTDLPLLHAAKVQMGINHAPRPHAEILHAKDKSFQHD